MPRGFDTYSINPESPTLLLRIPGDPESSYIAGSREQVAGRGQGFSAKPNGSALGA
ncbi:hypothetical protein BN59_03135 [Legionella massiliensis]|uniref:Uncharacterized protein n=1 Tax=Legionella massiliensis TaxID=1034943 RepID=A0A078L0X9_9GAMM|nr:hypothetical protein BN59_03135 [Legionella massiliensis]CEE14559.1 hypothetical protein BN1094_03135 [Legionella massiliensis]